MGEPGQRQQRLVRGDVRGRLLAADVLLAGLQGQDIGAPAFDVGRLTDDPAGHAPHIVGARGHEPVVRSAVRLVVARRLALADRDRAPVDTRRLEHAEGDRVDVGDGERAGVVRGGREVRRRLEAAEEVRLLEDDARGVAGGFAELVGVGDPVAVRHLDDLEPEARRVGLHDLADLRVERLGEHDARAARDVLRDVAGVCGDGRPVVAGRVGDVHPGQLADRGLVLEDRLQHALAHLGLVRRVAPSGARRAGGRRRRPPGRSGRRSRRRGTRARGRCRRSARRAPRGARRSPARRAPARGRARGRSARLPGCRGRARRSSRRRSPRASRRGRAPSARGSSLLGDEGLVGRSVHQVVRLRGVARGGCARASRRRTDPRSPSPAPRRPSGSPRSRCPRAARSDPRPPSPTRPRRRKSPSSPRRRPPGGSKWTRSPSESCANQVIPRVASSPSILAQSCSAL